VMLFCTESAFETSTLYAWVLILWEVANSCAFIMAASFLWIFVKNSPLAEFVQTYELYQNATW
jgi:hypothetical protein